MISAALVVAAWLDLGGSAVLCGGLVYGALVEAPTEAGDRSLRVAVIVVALALGLELGLTAIRMAQVSDVRGMPLVVDVLDARWGRLWVLRGLGLAAVASRTRVASLLALPWLLFRSLQGHAGAHGTTPALVDWAHLVAATVWIGGLVQLAAAVRPVPIDVARRMRALATAALAVLIPAGVYGALLHVTRWPLLLETRYGRALVVKLALASVLVTLGAVNHFRHVPALGRGDAAAARRLSTTVWFEVALAAAVLAVTAVLGELPMPHAG